MVPASSAAEYVTSLKVEAGLVDIAHSVVAQQATGGVAKVVRVVRGPHGERKDLARVRILNNDRPVERLVFFPSRDPVHAPP